MNNIIKQFFSYEVLLTIITGALFVFFMDLYGRTKKILYLLAGLLFTCVYIYYIYRLSFHKTDTNVVNLSAKVLPLVILTVMGVLIYKKKFSIHTFIGLFLIVVGSIMVAI